MQAMDREARLQAEDARFVLGALQRLDAGDPDRRFTGRLDLGKVGIAGHSFGGAVAAQASRLDPRFRAVANLDGWLLADAAEAGVERPYLKFNDDTPQPSAAELSASDPLVRHDAQTTERDWKRSHASFARYGGYELTVHGVNHMDFSDSPLYSPLKSLTHAGPIGADRVIEITETYLLAFFRKHLTGSTEPLLDAPSPRFPEVDFVIWKPVAAQAERQ
jgi:dienelactone hydrolase